MHYTWADVSEVRVKLTLCRRTDRLSKCAEGMTAQQCALFEILPLIVPQATAYMEQLTVIIPRALQERLRTRKNNQEEKMIDLFVSVEP